MAECLASQKRGARLVARNVDGEGPLVSGLWEEKVELCGGVGGSDQTGEDRQVWQCRVLRFADRAKVPVKPV